MIESLYTTWGKPTDVAVVWEFAFSLNSDLSCDPLSTGVVNKIPRVTTVHYSVRNVLIYSLQ